ncbi:hypothetical protein HK100_002768 [Physocladia obscura]|uniref:Peptidase A1 domain-containing protein n=1 Tax=Physocladia obscura TaxID=109957 RepID=A0AAD5SWG9_9FUNG|nr:hypothetical protein HK100_002768 [Physocladia obscura]
MQTVALLALAVGLIDATAPFKLPIARKRAPTKEDLDVSLVKFTIGRSATTGSLSAPLTNGGLGNYFYSSLIVGGNSEAQSVCFDTGSSDTWVIGSTCTADSQGGCTPNEVGSVVVNSNFVTTGVKGQTLYGTGTYGVNYTIYNTTVTYGTATATNLPVGLATYLFGGMSGFGILGMGWNDISQIASDLDAASKYPASANPIHNANFLDHLGLSLFGVYINEDNVNGEVSFGYLDSSKYPTGSTFQYFPVTSFTYDGGVSANGWWQFIPSQVTISHASKSGKVSSLSYTSYASQTPTGVSIADSGTPELVFVTSAATTINKWLYSKYNANVGTIPCTGNSLTITLTSSPGGAAVAYSIPYSLLALADGGVCYSLISGGAESIGFTIYGAPFFQSVYSAFDKLNSRLGFVPL